MPFDLANTFISSDSNSAQVPVTRTANQTLAQKMHHMVTADNDLSRKSIFGNVQEVSSTNNLYNKYTDDDNHPKSHQRVSAKIPAKVMQKESQKNQKWMATETV